MAALRFFGWKVVWAAFVIAVFGAGAGFYGPSIFLEALHTSRGWNVSAISAAITTHFLVSAVIVMYLPELHRRIPIATVTKAGVTSCGAGIICWANAAEPWQLFPAALLTGVGWASTSSAAINAMIAPWFDRQRPKALSLALNGASVGGVVFAPLWVLLIFYVGFAGAAFVIAVTMVLVIWPLCTLFLRPSPIGMGLAPDGQPAASGTLDSVSVGLSRAELLCDRRFVTLSASFALGLFAQIGLLAHLVTRLAPELGPRGAAAALSLTTLCAIIGRTLLGWFMRENERRIAGMINFLVQSCGVLLLSIGSGPAQLVLGCILFGLAGGNHLTLPPLIAQSEFLRRDVNTVVALVVAINQAIMALGPALFGILHDTTGGYGVPFAIAALAQVVAAFILLAGRPRSGTQVAGP